MREITLESWEKKTLRVCLTAPAFMARWAAEHMEPRRSGVIINISSIMSWQAAGIAPAYIACKGAIDSLTYELASLYGPSGIRVVAINPGAIDTEMSRDYRDDSGQSVTDQEIPRCSARGHDHGPPLGQAGRDRSRDRVCRL